MISNESVSVGTLDIFLFNWNFYQSNKIMIDLLKRNFETTYMKGVFMLSNSIVIINHQTVVFSSGGRPRKNLLL